MMTKDEMSAKGLELVAFAGEARTYYLEALNKAKKKDFKGADKAIEQGSESLKQAHIAQTELIHNEAKGKYSDITMIMVHGQDHLMTTVLLRDLIGTLIDIYRKKKW